MCSLKDPSRIPSFEAMLAEQPSFTLLDSIVLSFLMDCSCEENVLVQLQQLVLQTASIMDALVIVQACFHVAPSCVPSPSFFYLRVDDSSGR